MPTNIEEITEEYYGKQLGVLDDSNFRSGTIIVNSPGEEIVESHYNLLNFVISKKGYEINGVIPSYNSFENVTELHINVLRRSANA